VRVIVTEIKVLIVSTSMCVL